MKREITELYEIFKDKLGEVALEDVRANNISKQVSLTSVKYFLEYQDDDPDFVDGLEDITDAMIKYINEKIFNEFKFEGQIIPGWRCLPRICFRIFTDNTFFFTRLMEIF